MRREEPGLPKHESVDRAGMAMTVHRHAGRGGPWRRRRRNPFPERLEALDSRLWCVTRNDRAIDRADGDAGYPVGHVLRCRKRLVNAGLIAAEGPSALQDESDLLVVGLRASGRLLFIHTMIEPARPTDLWSHRSAFSGTAAHRGRRKSVD